MRKLYLNLIGWLISFSNMSTYLGLFYTKRLGNPILCTFYFYFLIRLVWLWPANKCADVCVFFCYGGLGPCVFVVTVSVVRLRPFFFCSCVGRAPGMTWKIGPARFSLLFRCILVPFGVRQGADAGSSTACGRACWSGSVFSCTSFTAYQLL